MFAAHFAAALAIKSRVPTAPIWALLSGAFLPDFIWIALANRGVEPTQLPVFFDDWSHSLATTALWATLFAACFWKSGRAAMAALWAAVFSHFLLDFPIHPKALGLYPHSSVRLGLFLSASVGKMKYWWVQLAVLLVLTLIYAQGTRRNGLPGNLIAATCVLLLSLHLLML
jgi:hypothetical protein